jgi:Fanconi anemia group M protein
MNFDDHFHIANCTRYVSAGRAATQQIVCLVVDEAHRATGNYSYCVVVREVSFKCLILPQATGFELISFKGSTKNLKPYFF